MAISLPPPPASSYHPVVADDNTLTRSWSQWFNQVYNILQEAAVSAPNASSYIIQTADPLLPNAQVLSNLVPGFVLVGSGGVLISTNSNLIHTGNIANNAVTSTQLSNTGVNPTTYGNSTQVGQFTVGSDGRLTAAGNVTITGSAPGGAAGGDLTGTYPNPVVSQINTVPLGSTTATSGNLLIGSGTAWVTNPMSGDATITSSGVVSVANSAKIAITDDTTTNATMFPLWVTANTGNLPAKVTSTKLSFNPSTGALSSTSFIGNLTGNASTVTTNANLTGDVTSVGNATTYNNTVPVTKGGTGKTTISSGSLWYGGAGNTLTELAIAGSGTILMSNGSIPSWSSAPATKFGGFNELSITSNTTLTNSNKYELISTAGGSGPFTITLPARSTVAADNAIWFQFLQTSGIVTIAANAADTLDGAASATYAFSEGCMIAPGGNNQWTTVVDHRLSSSTVPDYVSYTYFGGV